MDLGSAKFFAQLAFQLHCILAKTHRAQPARSRGHQQSSKRRRNNRILNSRPRPTAPIGPRSHSKLLASFFVEPAGRPESCVVQCRSHIVSFAQSVLDLLHAPCRLVLAWTEPG